MNRRSVLFVHNRYQERGGEDAVFEAEASLMEANGHRVGRLVFDNRDLPEAPSMVDALRLGVETVWSRPARRRLKQALAEFAPEVVHFHNTFPQVSPAAYSVCHDAGAAVVQTLHNYRLVCANGLLYRDGAPCEECAGRRVALPALRHACYRGSRAQTGAVVSMLALHRLRGTWRRDVDLYIAPSEFLRDKLIEGGLPAERIAVKPNFLEPDPGPKTCAGDYALFVGRLTASKGVETLLEAYRRRDDLPPLHVAGDGELAAAVQDAAYRDERIVYRGRLDRAGVMTEMGGAACLVFPSRWYENFPVTIVEAFARGLPVVASNLGAIPEIVADGRTGVLFAAGDADDLGEKLACAAASPGTLQWMGAAARAEYACKYGGERNYELLIEVYERALAKGRKPEMNLAEARS
ncbi:MAG TPA: glycosyltransferase [Dehalococcoidia bacterium]|nr:glycosyltransferase [Dehalococcoidia bacterium]